MLVKSRLYLNFKFSYSPVPPPLHLHFWISGLEKVSLCSKMLHNFHQFKESLNRTIKKFHILRIFLRFYNLFGHRISTLEKQPRTSVFFTSILFLYKIEFYFYNLSSTKQLPHGVNLCGRSLHKSFSPESNSSYNLQDIFDRTSDYQKLPYVKLHKRNKSLFRIIASEVLNDYMITGCIM